MNKLYISPFHNPYRNLSIEEYLFNCNKSDIIFYLWQNDNTIVIGKHQNLFKEVNMPAANAGSVNITRRITGGGAVYHDLGNLNFSFIVPSTKKDILQQLSVLIEALKEFGINAYPSGRNDILINGRKCSGNAFRDSKTTHLHHGTLLIDSDIEKLSRYLSPSKMKLTTKGFGSIKSRVINLSEVSSIGVSDISSCLQKSFRNIYGDYEIIENSFFDDIILKKVEDHSRSYEWIYGNTPAYDMQFDARLSFGEISFNIVIGDKGTIKNIDIYTDAMNVTFIDELQKSFIGSRFDEESIKAILQRFDNPEASEIENWITNAIV